MAGQRCGEAGTRPHHIPGLQLGAPPPPGLAVESLLKVNPSARKQGDPDFPGTETVVSVRPFDITMGKHSHTGAPPEWTLAKKGWAAFCLLSCQYHQRIDGKKFLVKQTNMYCAWVCANYIAQA